jgi:multiple sugar transport system permease protein
MAPAFRRGATQRRRVGSLLLALSAGPLPFVLPSLILLTFVIAYPALDAFYLSLTHGSLIRTEGFVGLANYIDLASSPDFLNALRFSAVFAVASIVACYVIGLALAVLMQQTMPARGVLRVLLLLPWIIPSVVAVVGWRWMVGNDHAFVNQVIGLFGGKPIYFLSSYNWAAVVVIVIKVWRSVPFMMLSLLAALQGIDRSVYEAAAIDGASRLQSFLFVTLPQIRGVSIVLCLLMTIWTVNDFDTPWLLTQGGPANSTENLVVIAYRYTFNRSDVGHGSAVAIATLVVLMVLVVFALRQQRTA